MKYIQTSDRFSADAVMLAHFVRPKGRACELCAGGGIISLILSARYPDLSIDAVEIDPAAAETMAENFRINSLDSHLHAVCGDLRLPILTAGGYGTVFCNPPYFNSGRLHSTRSHARSEVSCTLSEVCSAAGRLLCNGGRFFAVYRPERLASIFCEMKNAGIEPKRLAFIKHRYGAAPSAVLIEGRKGGGEGLVVLPELILFKKDGQPTAKYREIYGEFL
ncbi:MAG: methyltransferase [Clostridia bacterium]|nr:methyltransferase [Clostridia bacterium]